MIIISEYFIVQLVFLSILLKCNLKKLEYTVYKFKNR